MKVCFETFGCRLNRAEALEEEARFVAAGWERTEKHAEADCIIVRGCSVTARAQRECEKFVLHLKRKYPSARVVVEGCLKAENISHAKAPVIHLAEDARPLPTRTARAYLKVQDGCSGRCTFCIVPQFRGKSMSVPFEEVVDKAKRFVDAGYREIVVTGCNLALYAAKGRRLDGLVATLAEIDPNCRIRLGSLEPGDVARDVVEVMAEIPNVCRFLHVPIQSGSNRILMSMCRPYLMNDVTSLLTAAERLVPDIALGCDLIVGYPGETEMDFTATKALVSRFGFSNAHIFPYSNRPDTVASKLSDQLPREIRSRRAHEIAKITDASRARFAARFLGKTVSFVVEDQDGHAGWSGEYLWCTARGRKANRKEIVQMRVTQIKDGGLMGVLV